MMKTVRGKIIKIILKKHLGSWGFFHSPFLMALVSALLLVSVVIGEAAEQKTPATQKPPAPQAPTAIPLADVATRATEVSNLLSTMDTELAPSPGIETIEKQLPGVSERIALELAGTMSLIQKQPTLATIQAQQQLWQKRQRDLTRWLNLLTQRATQLQTSLNQLADLQKRWSETRDTARMSKAPVLILEEINTVLSSLDTARTPLEAQRIAVLDLQSHVADGVAKCGTALAQIAKLQRRAVGGLLKRESLPIWSADLRVQARAEGSTPFREIAASSWSDINQYFRDPSKGMLIHIGLFMILAILLSAGRRQIRRWALAGESSTFATTAFDRPYATALVATLFVASSPNLPTPSTVRQLFSVLELAPMIRLTLPVVDPGLISPLYALFFLFALNTVRQIFAGMPLIEQTAIMVEILAGMAVLGWMLIFGHLRQSQTKAPASTRITRLRAGAFIILLVLGVGLLAAALGYIRLARLTTSGLLIGGALALTLYAYLRVTGSVVAFALHVWPLRLLRMVQRHRDLVERRIYHVLVLFAVAAWIIRFLDYVGLFQPTLSLGKAILAVKLERGSISISLGDVLAFLLTLWVAYLFSNFIRFLLQEDVYPRMRIERGLSYALSSLLHYFILALGFVVGLGVLGVDLTKITVLASAFGVGIGFGLQSVVNNFVSGLILLFEQPIHVGDTVEIGDLLGEVKRIGIRSSVVRTWRGAEIIVPNAQLVSERVTNWTLSDQLRRIDLPVGVNYGAEPQEVIKVLERVAAAHPRVLKHPAPQGLFVAYGDSSINFELRAWTDQFDTWYQTRSELAVALYKAVHDAGMTFPFPQREVRLLRDPEAGSTPVPSAGVVQPLQTEEQGKPPAGQKDKAEGTEM
jgi:small-conductance mechanosensitive channel